VSARIRGHYRIDSSGRVEPITDVNSAALKVRPQVSPLPGHRSLRITRISILGAIAMVICISGMLAMPSFQRYLISIESQRYATVRHMHGLVLRSTAQRLLHGDY
jgi:hypothetical protein